MAAAGSWELYVNVAQRVWNLEVQNSRSWKVCLRFSDQGASVLVVTLQCPGYCTRLITVK